MIWLKSLKISFIVIFTKSDKIKPKLCNEKAKIYLEQLKKKIKIKPKALISSSFSKFGREKILAQIKKEIQLEGD